MQVWTVMVNRWDGGTWGSNGHDAVHEVWTSEEAAEVSCKKATEAEEKARSWDSPRFFVTGPHEVRG